jgi:hypothetical protein
MNDSDPVLQFPELGTASRPRHILFWTVVAAGLIPISVCAGAAVLYEVMDSFYARLRVWCYREKYARKGARHAPGPSR